MQAADPILPAQFAPQSQRRRQQQRAPAPPVRPRRGTMRRQQATYEYAHDTDVVMNDGTSVIRTTVTNSGDAVKGYLREVREASGGAPLTVGLDTEWRVVYDRKDGRRCGHRMAVLQLCVGRRCLVFQTATANYIPATLHTFLGSTAHRFVGVAVDGDAERLYCDHGIAVSSGVDLRHVGAEVLSRPELRRAGLKTLTRDVMGMQIDKPKHVTMSKWSMPLSPEQVRYAAIDAFVSYEVGRLLLTSQRAQDMAPFVSFELP